MKNPFLIYQAKSFYNAYLALEQIKPADDLLLIVPTLVNGAFSIELTIKAILVEQGIHYDKEHNLKILFDKLPAEIQKRIWGFLATKVPEFSDITKCENELLIMSEAFVQWRYSFEDEGAPSVDRRFLAGLANAAIFVMFDLGYNTFYTSSPVPHNTEKYAEVDAMIEQNRKTFLEKNGGIVQKKKRGEQK